MLILRILPLDLAAKVFELLELSTQEQLLKAMGQEEPAGLLNNGAGDRTLLLEELPAIMTKQILAQLTPRERAFAVSLLGYPEGSICRWLTPDYIRTRVDPRRHRLLTEWPLVLVWRLVRTKLVTRYSWL